MYIYLYNQHSESGNDLKEHLDVPRIRHNNSTFRGSPAKTVINWGCSDLPREVRKCRVINNENSVALAVNKRRALEHMASRNVPCVEFTRDIREATAWLQAGHTVYCRGLLEGHDGAGLTVCTSPNEELPTNARLYTKGVPIDKEYRVSIVSGAVIAAQRKVKHDDAERTTSDLVRTSGNGWGFKLVNHERYVAEPVLAAARSAVESLGLDFGGVDVVLLPSGVARVLEVNTAPQLTPTVCHRMAQALRRYYGAQGNT